MSKWWSELTFGERSKIKKMVGHADKILEVTKQKSDGPDWQHRTHHYYKVRYIYNGKEQTSTIGGR